MTAASCYIIRDRRFLTVLIASWENGCEFGFNVDPEGGTEPSKMQAKHPS
jgi:hypothetical protein